MASAASLSPIRVLIVGCSYGGISTAVNLVDLGLGLSPRLANTPYMHHPQHPRVPVDITIVDERDGFYHLIGSPLALADSEYAKKSWVKFQDIPTLQRDNVRFIQGSATAVDSEARTASVAIRASGEEQQLQYDFLVAASGLRRAWPVVPQSLSRKQFLLEAEDQIDAVSQARDGVVVVGGGAVGVEMAAELKMAKPDVKVTLVHSWDKLLSSEDLPDECKDRTLELVEEGGVAVLLNHRLAETKRIDNLDGTSRLELTFEDKSRMAASEVIMAISRSTPTSKYLPVEALDDEGYVKIRASLQFPEGYPGADRHLAVGDLARWSGIRRCGTAMHMGYYAAVNIHQTVLQELVPGYEAELLELQEIPPMIGLAVGRKAVAYGPESGTISGEDVLKAYFRDDLGFSICWNYMRLSETEDESKH